MYSTYSSPPPAHTHYSYMSSSPDRGGYSSPTYTSYTTPRPSKGSGSHIRRAVYEAVPSPSRQPPQFQYWTPPQYTYATPALRMKNTVPRDVDYGASAKRSRGGVVREDSKYRSRTSRSSKQDAFVRSSRDHGVHEINTSESDEAYAYPRRTQRYEVRTRHSGGRIRTDIVDDDDDDDYRVPQDGGLKAKEPVGFVRTRGRAATYPAKPSRDSAGSGHSRQRSTVVSPRPATAADAVRAGIPAGYSLKNWDPDEEPIYVLGSVFDANSLGKWIYDWTVFSHNPSSPLAEVAGDLWLNLIQLAGKLKRAQAVVRRIRHPDDRELVEDFISAGERLWDRLNNIIVKCEDYMWRAAKKDSGESAVREMGAQSGREFVDSMFGRDRELEDTEKLMTGMRLWSIRFDANCEDILRYPTA